MNKFAFIISIFIIIFASSNIKSIDISNELYPTSIGVDYDNKNKEYTLYFQIINPAYLSKNENTATTSKQSTFSLKQSGKSFYDCYNTLNSITKKRISLRHMQSLILSDTILDNPHISINLLLLLIKNPIIPTNLYLYSTKDKITNLYNNQNIIDESSFFSLLNNPQDSNISSIIYPLTLLSVTKNILDNNKMFYIPSIYLDDKIENSNNEGEVESNKVINIDGIYFSTINNDFKYIELDKLKGFNYVYNNKINSLEINDINDLYFIKIHSIKSNVQINNNENKLLLKFDGIDLICPYNHNLENIDEIIIKYIKQQLSDLYLLGTNNNIDIFHIKDYQYRYKKSLNNNELNIEIKTNYQSIEYYSMIT